MILLDIIIIVLFLLLAILSERKKSKIYVSFILIFVLLYSALTTQIKWQFILIYSESIILLLYTTRHKYLSKTYYSLQKKSRLLMLSVVSISIVVTIFICLLMPSIQLIPPTGKYIVGTEIHHLEDIDRKSPFSENPEEFRKLHAKVWFPAKRSFARLVKDLYWNHLPYIYTKEIMNLFKLPAFLMSHLYELKPYAYRFLDISDAKEQYPVVIMSHGYYSGTEISNTQLGEELASKGFIVVSINHMYESLLSPYKREEIKYGNLTRANVIMNEAKKTMKLHNLILRDPVKNKEKISNIYDQFKETNKTLNLWTNDILFVIDHLEFINKNLSIKKISGRMDICKISAIGFSMGGMASMEASMKDSRIKAIINMDGPATKNSFLNGVPVPFLQMSSTTWKTINTISVHKNDTNHFHYFFKDTKHNNFEDMSVFFPILTKYMGSTGSVDSRYHIQRIRDISVNFLNTFLNNNELFTSPKNSILQDNMVVINEPSFRLENEESNTFGNPFELRLELSNKLMNEIEIAGVKKCFILLDSLLKNNPEKYTFNDQVLNTIGYQLIEELELDIAIQIFIENTKRYPNVANVFDSLGEAYLANNNRELAIKNFRYVLKLDASFENSKNQLDKLGVKYN